MQTTLRFHSLTFRQSDAYVAALLFAAGNVLLPQLCHLVRLGGPTWLPIYFFTLVGAYKFGWRVGLLTAVLSPLANSLCFGMPVPAVLPAILAKSMLLALAAGFAAARFRRASLPLLLGVVLTYQLLGSLAEWALTGSLLAATQDFRLGLPGMAVQLFGGWAVINRLIRR